MVSLREYPTMEQRSDEWYAARCGIVTASTVGNLITQKTLKPANNDQSRGFTRLLAAERITRHVEETYTSADMWRGIELEPVARELYSKHYAVAREYGFMVDEYVGIGYSPDGVVGTDGLIEIKCPRPKNHLETILNDQVPVEYVPQVQCALLVSGRAWLDFISFAPGMPLYVKRVTPDHRWYDVILDAVDAFETNIRGLINDYNTKVADLIPTERQDLEIVI